MLSLCSMDSGCEEQIYPGCGLSLADSRITSCWDAHALAAVAKGVSANLGLKLGLPAWMLVNLRFVHTTESDFLVYKIFMNFLERWKARKRQRQ